MDFQKTLKQALFYRERFNFSVVPVEYGGKKPLVKWKKYQTVLPEEEEIRRWFKNPANIAIVTGSISKIVVIDVDDRNTVPDWLRDVNTWVCSTGRGYHFYFKINEEVIPTTKLSKQIDLKGEGSYVIAPVSLHPSGHIYKWKKFIKNGIEFPADFELVRDHVLEMMKKSTLESSRKFAELYRGVSEGERNVSLTKIAGSLFSDGLNRDEVYAILSVVNERNIPPLPEKEVRAIVKSIEKKVKDYSREKERFKSIAGRIISRALKADSDLIRLLGRLLSAYEEFKESLPEKEREYFERQFGKVVFPELVKLLRVNHMLVQKKEKV